MISDENGRSNPRLLISFSKRCQMSPPDVVQGLLKAISIGCLNWWASSDLSSVKRFPRKVPNQKFPRRKALSWIKVPRDFFSYSTSSTLPSSSFPSRRPSLPTWRETCAVTTTADRSAWHFCLWQLLDFLTMNRYCLLFFKIYSFKFWPKNLFWFVIVSYHILDLDVHSYVNAMSLCLTSLMNNPQQNWLK